MRWRSTSNSTAWISSGLTKSRPASQAWARAQRSRAMEPRASTPAKRLEAISRLADAGCPVGVGFAPVIPGLNDHELESILEAAAKAGATRAMYVTLRLPLEIKDLFHEWLADARPDRAARVMSLVRQTRGGRDCVARYGGDEFGFLAFRDGPEDAANTVAEPVTDLLSSLPKFALRTANEVAKAAQPRQPRPARRQRRRESSGRGAWRRDRRRRGWRA